MRYIYILFALLFASSFAQAQVAEDLAVELTDTVQYAPAQITLRWKLLTVDTPTYVIWRKAKTAITWGASIATLPSTVSSFTDTNVVVDSNYEYQVWAEGPLLTQNNGSALYEPQNYGAGYIHVALMGDLTLRTDYIQPPSNLVIATGYHGGATLNWTASPDTAVLGYYVYRADSAYGYFQRLNAMMLTTTTYMDGTGVSGLKYYMVRPVKLQNTPSGTYYNLGVGITDTATVSYSTLRLATLQPSLDCDISPNPAQNDLNVSINTDIPVTVTMYVTDIAGNRFYTTTKQLTTGTNKYSLNITRLTPGVYTLVLESGGASIVKKWVKD